MPLVTPGFLGLAVLFLFHRLGNKFTLLCFDGCSQILPPTDSELAQLPDPHEQASKKNKKSNILSLPKSAESLALSQALVSAADVQKCPLYSQFDLVATCFVSVFVVFWVSEFFACLLCGRDEIAFFLAIASILISMVGASKALVHWGIQDEMERAHKTVRESFVRQRLAELQAAQEEAEKQQQQQEQQKQEEKSKKKPQQQSQAAASGPRK